MKRIVTILLIISVTRIGVAYAADTTTGERNLFFFGSSQKSSQNLNQVLALLVGPQGPPGPAGVAGKDGFVGMNGQDGKDGLPGAPGAVGPRGATGATGATGAAGAAGGTVAVVALASGDANCSNGGTKFIAADGTISYACNGSNGSGGSGGSIGYGTGEVSVGSCTDTATVTVASTFTGTDFVMNQITLDGLKSACVGKDLSIYFAIRTDSTTATLKNTTGEYTWGNKIKCRATFAGTTAGKVPAQANWGTPHLTITSSITSCTVIPNATPTFVLNKISTSDYTNAIGFEIS